MADSIDPITRLSAAIVGCTLTPPLVALAYFRWTRDLRKDLPHWRNSAGLTSLVIISTAWVLQSTRWALLMVHHNLIPYGADSIWLELERFFPVYFLCAALLLAFALKGVSRILMIAAWVLVQLYWGAFIYR